jgi:predicted DCC family thiol-disulfide oxidoreductase YuxK
MTEMPINSSRGLKACEPADLLFDADCPICAKLANHVTPFLTRLGVSVSPLQTAGPRHNLAPADLLARIHLVFPDGRKFTGADALIELARRCAWTRPFTSITKVPGTMPLLRRAYDWIARHRHCLQGKCFVPLKRGEKLPHKTRRVFFEMP